ncbi:hypothetical protein AX16_006123 [Volvariella volvacea WC 439]|nr:hypothetical protein AX16_006123 [Volvariella volvacea WC 439]
MRCTTTSILAELGLFAHAATSVAAKSAFLSTPTSHLPRALCARQSSFPECEEDCGLINGVSTRSAHSNRTHHQCAYPPHPPNSAKSLPPSAFAAYPPHLLTEIVYRQATCVGTASGDTDFSEPQQFLDGKHSYTGTPPPSKLCMIVNCFQAGIPVPILTLPGQDPDRPLPTDSTSESESATSAPTSSTTESESESQTSATATSAPTDDAQSEDDNNAGSRTRVGLMGEGWLGPVGLVGAALAGGAVVVL